MPEVLIRLLLGLDGPETGGQFLVEVVVLVGLMFGAIVFFRMGTPRAGWCCLVSFLGAGTVVMYQGDRAEI